MILLADVLAKLLLLRDLNPDDAVFSSVWYGLLLAGTAAYLAGSAVIGLIVWRRGDDIVPWWK